MKEIKPLELLLKLARPSVILKSELKLIGEGGLPTIYATYRHKNFGECNIDVIYQFRDNEWKEQSKYIRALEVTKND